MSPSQQDDAEACARITKLRDLLQKPSSADKVRPLVAALLAQKVDIHEKMLTDLGTRAKQMEENISNESEHTIHITKQVHNIEQDVMSLRQLIQTNEQRDTESGADLHQLDVRLTEAIKQNHTETIGLEQSIQVIGEAMEKQQEAANGVVESLRNLGQHMTSLKRDFHELKNGIEKVPFSTTITRSIAKLEERMMEYFDRNSNDAGNTLMSPEIIKNQLDTHEKLACGSPAQDAIDQPTIDDRSPSDSPTSQGQQKQKQPSLDNWPAIAEFLTTYEASKAAYKSQKPESDPEFITNFLNSLNVHVSCALQRHLSEIYPYKVVLVAFSVGQPTPNIFIRLCDLRWIDIRRAIPKMKNLKDLQWAVNEGISGPSPL
ncbi:hypothetical protein F5Y12DRAFT_222125 [Xylaria sp. FL1777]|nr:hypothetical protein F5Y12DRAFT_222125 [Xylaria sp. FL1777]